MEQQNVKKLMFLVGSEVLEIKLKKFEQTKKWDLKNWIKKLIINEKISNEKVQ